LAGIVVSSTKNRVQFRRSSLLQREIWQQVAVRVECELDRGVPQDFLDDLWMLAGGEKNRRVAVTATAR